MATDLTFTQTGSRYECVITPSDPTTIQVSRGGGSDFTVYAYIDDMNPVSIFTTNIYDNLIFQLDVPEGVSVRMVSWSPVTAAKML